MSKAAAEQSLTEQSSPNADEGQTGFNIPWYAQSCPALLVLLAASREGLSDREASQRQQRYGKNILPGRKPVHPFSLLLHQFRNPLIYILLAASVVSMTIGDREDALFILAVILLNAVIGAVQEWKAEQGTVALQKLLKTYVHARRNGMAVQIDAEALVPGDIVYLASGSRVPADTRILEANNLYVDESLLTGESMVVHKNAQVLPSDPLPVAEQNNMLFAGTVVSTGRAEGMIVATGLSTELGKIAQAVTGTETPKTPLIVRMERFSKRIGYLVLASCVVLALAAMATGTPAEDVFFMAVALAVAAIPEGLPVAMTVALSVATSRMAKRKVLIRKLMAVEGLGSCTLIATDKTGTLTLNRQTVRLVCIAGHCFKVSGDGYSGEGHINQEGGEHPTEPEWVALKHMARVAVLCNEASLYQNPAGEWRAEGDPVDIALLAMAYKAGLNPVEVWESIEPFETIPYESARLYAALVYRHEGQAYLAIKGAAEALFPHCRTRLTPDGEIPVNPSEIDAELQALTNQGYRVLVIGHCILPDAVHISHVPLPDLTLIGLVALVDPLRPEATAAISTCRQAGIKVVMITGDHPSTALAIGQELGIAASPAEVMTGHQLTQLNQAPRPVLLQALQTISIFARVAPLQKHQIVEALKEAGHYVAVTGDGVNDAPALKTANIGVAMGSGTDVAKDAASMIITDDNFSSIVSGVEEGRFAYDNIRKALYLLLSTGAAEVILFILTIVANLPLPLLAVQLLWLNLATNGIQHVALAFEKGEPDAILRPPRPPGEEVFNSLMIQQTLLSGSIMAFMAFGLWFGLLHFGWEELPARNLVLLFMVILQNVHVFNCRSEHQSAFRIPLRQNRFLLLAVVGAQGLHVGMMHLPAMQTILHIQPIRWQEWLGCIVLAITLLGPIELFKYYKRKKNLKTIRI